MTEIPQSQLALANSEGGLSCFSYTSNFPVEDGFSRTTFNSAISDGLLLIVDSGNPPSDAYTFQLATIPEPGVAELLGLGSVFLLHRRRNRRGGWSRNSRFRSDFHRYPNFRYDRWRKTRWYHQFVNERIVPYSVRKWVLWAPASAACVANTQKVGGVNIQGWGDIFKYIEYPLAKLFGKM